MSKKTIVLADNSYTIRRIVELSFSEEEDIDLVSFENSTNLRERLLELRPAIVLVDIKLPEFNGYEVCKYVNNTENLKQTRVFLLKGGFEPVDENLLKGLRFVDIITKPFDSNALVATIKNLLKEIAAGAPPTGPEEMPPSLPEDLAEVENLVESDEEISFSDIKDDIEPGDLLSGASAGPSRGPSIYPDDDVLPSEEITQAQGGPPDTLAPTFTSAEDIDNPFQDEMPTAKQAAGGLYDEEFDIKRNIRLEEQDLQIGSLTEEEMDIKKRIGARENELFRQNMADDEFKVSDEEMSAVDEMFSFTPGAIEKKTAFQDIPDLKPAEIEKEMGLDTDFEESPPSRKIRMPHVDTQPEVDVEEEIQPELEIGPGTSEFDDLYQPPSPFDEKPGTKISSIGEELAYLPPIEPMELEAPVEIEAPEVEISDYNAFGNDHELDMEIGPPVMEYEIPAPTQPPPRATRPVPPAPHTPPAPPPSSRPMAFTPQTPPKQSVRTTPNTPTIPPTSPAAPKTPPPPPPASPKQAVRPTPTPSGPPAPPPQPRPAEVAKPFVGKEIPAMENEQVLSKVEDKLAIAVKEMLWEIVPPLAEKIIKEEIEKIKSDVSKSFK
ncbi:MAG: response regulator [Candidatus Aminicenantes bacterium]|nr:response regulator [Candidatus Aminicenantes bacterium]